MEAVCTIKSDIDNVTDTLAGQILSTKERIEQTANQGMANIQRLRDQAVAMKASVQNTYQNMGWRSKRPDITFLAELLFLVMLGLVLYTLLPYITGRAAPGFSPEQFKRAKKLPAGAFSIEQLAQVRLESESYAHYHDYFTKGRAAYSLANSGIFDMILSVVTLPIIMFVMQYVLPPFVIAYILWFIIRYWPYVWAAAWGFFLMLYSYFTDLIEGRLGCKWYIRMVTGWRCRHPDFFRYFTAWRQKYIDRPLYYEQLYYVKEFIYARDEYLYKPYQQYVVEPLEQLLVEAKYAKRVYLDRTLEVLLRILRGSDRRTLQELAETADTGRQLGKQALGRPYASTTQTIGATGAVDEEECDCPAEPTAIGAYFDSLSKQVQDAKQHVSSLWSTAAQVKASITPGFAGKAGTGATNSSSFSCQNMSKLQIGQTNRYLFLALVLIVIMGVLGTYWYVRTYGTPFWIGDMFGASQVFVHHGAKLISQGYSWANPLAYLGALCALLLLFMVK